MHSEDMAKILECWSITKISIHERKLASPNLKEVAGALNL